MEGKKEKEKRTKYYVKGWGYAALILSVFILISPCFSALMSPIVVPDEIVDIGWIEARWTNGFISFCWVKSFLLEPEVTIIVCGDEVDIRVEVDCKMFYESPAPYRREVDVKMVLHLDGPEGRTIGEGGLTLSPFEKDIVLSVDGEFDSFDDETRYIWCEIIVTPYIVLFTLPSGEEGDVPGFLRIRWYYSAEASTCLTCDIIHEC